MWGLATVELLRAYQSKTDALQALGQERQRQVDLINPDWFEIRDRVDSFTVFGKGISCDTVTWAVRDVEWMGSAPTVASNR